MSAGRLCCLINNKVKRKERQTMEKLMGEDEFKGLEAEIDSAVDRLFVEKEKEGEEGLIMKFTKQEPSHEVEQGTDSESPIRPSSKPLPFFRPGEKMETQLLSLEWEITKDNLQNTREEVLALRRNMGEKPEITMILNWMEKILNRMIENEESISPPWINFLMDSKETIKLLMRKETDNEIGIYKQLAYRGIEARFFRLEGFKDTPTQQPSLSLSQETEKAETLMPGGKQIQEMFDKMSLFLDKMETFSKGIDIHLSSLRQETRKPLDQDLLKTKPLLVNITVFKVDERLFGVESDKIFRLFKVPSSFHSKYIDQQKIRLKGLEVRVIDLKKIFSIQGGDPKGEVRILTVKDNGEYKGLMVDEVLKRLSTHSDVSKEYSEYCAGTIHWTYQQHVVEIPVLDLKKF
jgi:chemotaxis signal transduction protein